LFFYLPSACWAPSSVIGLPRRLCEDSAGQLDSDRPAASLVDVQPEARLGSAWGTYWRLLTVKVILALVVFAISLALTLPFNFLERFRARRRLWLTLALAVILVSAYLRRA
jgi:hypothetical protein